MGDSTYLPRQGGGWLYLAMWLDRCSRKIVGWDVRETISEDLVSEALRRALAVMPLPRLQLSYRALAVPTTLANSAAVLRRTALRGPPRWARSLFA